VRALTGQNYLYPPKINSWLRPWHWYGGSNFHGVSGTPHILYTYVFGTR